MIYWFDKIHFGRRKCIYAWQTIYSPERSKGANALMSRPQVHVIRINNQLLTYDWKFRPGKIEQTESKHSIIRRKEANLQWNL